MEYSGPLNFKMSAQNINKDLNSAESEPIIEMGLPNAYSNNYELRQNYADSHKYLLAWTTQHSVIMAICHKIRGTPIQSYTQFIL